MLDATKAAKLRKKRTSKYVIKIMSGKPIIEEETEEKITEHETDRQSGNSNREGVNSMLKNK